MNFYMDQQGPSIDKPKSPEERAKDKEYEENTGKGFRKSKEAKFGLPYGDFVVDSEGNPIKIESGGTLSVNSEQEDSDMNFIQNSQETIETGELENSPLFPVLSHLLSQGHIDQEVYEKTVAKLQKSTKEEESTIILSAIKTVDNNDVKKSIIKQLEKPEEINEDNFEKTKFYEVSSALDLDPGIGGLEIMLAENYIEIPDKEGNQDEKKSLRTTIDITLNKILQNESKDFRQTNAELIAEIRNSSNLKESYSKLKELYKKDLITDAIAGGTKGKKEIERKKSSLQEKYKKIDKQISDAKQIEDELERQKKLRELELKRQEIIEEAKDVDILKGEIFKAGEIDKTPETQDKQAA